jgi:hypothetical protein
MLLKQVCRIIHMWEEGKDQPVWTEVSWISEKTGWKHQGVPRDVISATASAKEQIGRGEEDEDQKIMEEGWRSSLITIVLWPLVKLNSINKFSKYMYFVEVIQMHIHVYNFEIATILLLTTALKFVKYSPATPDSAL